MLFHLKSTQITSKERAEQGVTAKLVVIILGHGQVIMFEQRKNPAAFMIRTLYHEPTAGFFLFTSNFLLQTSVNVPALLQMQKPRVHAAAGVFELVVAALFHQLPVFKY